MMVSSVEVEIHRLDLDLFPSSSGLGLPEKKGGRRKWGGGEKREGEEDLEEDAPLQNRTKRDGRG